MLAAFLELLFCLTCVEAAVTLRMNKHTCGKAFHTLKPFQIAMSCWVGCLYAAPPLDLESVSDLLCSQWEVLGVTRAPLPVAPNPQETHTERLHRGKPK